MPEAQRIREVLKGFYTVIKGMDEYLRFVLLTGVSKFSKAGAFSGLNNLEDITMSPDFSAALGITQDELNEYFAEHIAALAEQQSLSREELLQKIRYWYDGFCFSARCQNVYNPYSLLLLFKQGRFANYWFETGTPTFLVKLLKEKNYDVQSLENMSVGELAFSGYEVEDLRVLSLLFQTGYLTVQGYDAERGLYRLSYPNYEVQNAFMERLLSSFSTVEDGVTRGYVWQLITALREKDWEQFFAVLQVFFADIPYDIQIRRERYYQTVFYLIFKLLGLQVMAEARTSRGRLDAVVELEREIFIFEFKLGGQAEAALAQIRERDYAAPYRLRGKDVYLVGVGFEMEAGGIADWQVAQETRFDES